jgi:chemotaxis protein histidine kinase CheA
MRYLLTEVNNEHFAILLNEIRMVLPVTKELVEGLRTGALHQHYPLDGRVREVHCLSKILFGTSSAILRGTRLLVPKDDSSPVFLCEIVTGLADAVQTKDGFLLVEGEKPFRILQLDAIQIQTETQHDG